MTSSPATDASPWAKLRRRKVVQWSLGYLAGSWAFLQVFEFVTETYEWPSQWRRLAVLVLVLGLPVVIVLAWYHGDRGSQRVSRTEVAILALLCLLGASVLWRYQSTLQISGRESTQTAPPPSATQPARPVDSRPSIAVLPFENRSPAPDDIYFSDGIQDDLLTRLARNSALKVIARTSVEQFRDTKLTAREIARRLGVATILEGGVQRAGERVRVTVQLIDATNDAHLWAESYDRKLTAKDLLDIQDDVSTAIAEQLRVVLVSPVSAAPVARPTTTNLHAWELYQLARRTAARDNSQGVVDAEGLYRQAIALDPAFALARVGLAEALLMQIHTRGVRRDVTYEQVRTESDKALQLDPGLAEAWKLAGSIEPSNERAEACFRKAIQLNPNLAPAYEKLSDLMWETGRRTESLELAEKAAALDPLSIGINQSLAQNLEGAGRLAEAESRYRHFVDIDPTASQAYVDLGLFLAYSRNRFAEAIPLVQKASELDPENANFVGKLAMLQSDIGNIEESRRLVSNAFARWPHRTYIVIMAAYQAANRGDWTAAVGMAQNVLDSTPGHPGAINLLVQRDVSRGDFAAARARYAEADPELFATRTPRITVENYDFAIDVATILLKTGEQDRARWLLDRSEEAIRKLRRTGTNGYGISDVAIYTLRGEKVRALNALHSAIAAGWRGPFWHGIDDDAALRNLVGEPAINAAVAEIERDMARQRAELAAHTSPGTQPKAPASTL